MTFFFLSYYGLLPLIFAMMVGILWSKIYKVQLSTKKFIYASFFFTAISLAILLISVHPEYNLIFEKLFLSILPKENSKYDIFKLSQGTYFGVIISLGLKSVSLLIDIILLRCLITEYIYENTKNEYKFWVRGVKCSCLLFVFWLPYIFSTISELLIWHSYFTHMQEWGVFSRKFLSEVTQTPLHLYCSMYFVNPTFYICLPGLVGYLGSI